MGADLRIFSYQPNPRLYKATIAARYSGARIEVVGARPTDLANWLWDFDARPLQDDERQTLAHFARTARTGFSGTLYKTDNFLRANPYGDVPVAFVTAPDKVADSAAISGVFESNSIMRTAANLGPNAGCLSGDSVLQRARIDSFLDRSLVFARDMQRYLLSLGGELSQSLHDEMRSALEGYLTGIDRALEHSSWLAGDSLSLADIVFVCELALFGNETRALQKSASELPPLLPLLVEYPHALAHLRTLADLPEVAQDLATYTARLPLDPGNVSGTD